MYPYYLYSDIPRLYEHKVWAEIDIDALTENYRTLCAITPSAKHICVVKGDAYGHTAEMCVKALLASGCRFFAVSCIEEALAVRQYCGEVDADILILGYTDPTQAKQLARSNIIQAIISEEYAKKLADAAKNASCRPRVHLALDTGMNRVGICARNANECLSASDMAERLVNCDDISLEGMFTHFSQADEEYDRAVAADSRTREQFERFDSVRKELASRGINLFCHACNSAAALRFPEYALDGVRFGIALYGIPPSEHFEPITKPVMSLHTVISHIHSVPAGEKVSYGGRYVPDSDRTVATLPIGYADGFLRAFRGFFVTVQTSIGNFKAPVVGSICMDQCMIDVTDMPVQVGDRVTVFGNDHDDISTLASLADTIEYEILCLVSARVPRIMKNDRLSESKL